ncbi:AAA family ATPase [Clostridium taeniosporum]|uniref:Nucleotide kinase n=1 Tax=Clostridium taeniosporum TaxID=394958 RepID=A0A1D7XJS8_9CLOT|nr:AAA family ATPase [Clostridium taeniosporum]AOR23577.1 nucleotide kinase [Clostridium taeniosporum]
MIKKFIIINGTMGVGKSTICENLYKILPNSAWLDGDWCAMINPFVTSDENKDIIINNITHILNNFLNSSSIEYVIFNWLIESEDIMNLILDNINKKNFKLYKITLTCSTEELMKRVGRDILDGKRNRDSLNRSLERVFLYEKMGTFKIDTTTLKVNEVINNIIRIISKE